MGSRQQETSKVINVGEKMVEVRWETSGNGVRHADMKGPGFDGLDDQLIGK